MKNKFLQLVGLAVLVLLTSCTTEPIVKGPPPPLILISLDGFRWDYMALHPAETPHLRELKRLGSSARALIPVYPSNTFPNHYSIVTGLYPTHHGIINNEMFDPTLQTFFHYNRPSSAHESVWWGGEPIWVTAGKQGRASASSFWVGSEAEIKGRRPTFWKNYDYTIPFEKRLDELIGWLKLPPDQRPAIITFYFEETNSAGHKFGPDSPELAATVKRLDGQIGEMQARLKSAGQVVNFVIVSDHGMANISPDHVVVLDDYLDPTFVQVDFFGSVAGLRPLDGDAPSVVRALSAIPHAKAYLLQDLPARFHIGSNPRNPPVWVVPDEGWEIETRAHFRAVRGRYLKGDHGYDNALDDMHGILIASGPSFKSGVVVDPVENIHIYNLLCAALQLTPAPNDGDDRLVKAFLKE
ncbi:MAG: ectonucleotide pyrophosphatase/phosphodiesterase [Opitutaceae bacterium]